jgi:hypothetical protein
MGEDRGSIEVEKGHPNSDALHLTERWTAKTTLNLPPDTERIEAFCDDHAKTMEQRSTAPPLPEPPSPAIPGASK